MQFFYSLLQTGGHYGLEQVVNGLRLKCLNGVLVVGSYKHQLWEGASTRASGGPLLGQFGGGIKATHAGHADVKEQHIGLQGQRLAHGAGTVAHRGHYPQRGPGAGQFSLQGLGEQVLIFGDQGSGRCCCRHGSGLLGGREGQVQQRGRALAWCGRLFHTALALIRGGQAFVHLGQAKATG